MVLVVKELKWYNVDIAALSEMCLLAGGQCIESGVGHAFWKGNPSNRNSIYGVGSVLVSNMNLIPTGMTSA